MSKNPLTNFNWNPPKFWQKIETIDLHTGGEPLRVFVNGLPKIEGNTILEKRRYFCENLDDIRTGIMWEPRGHADMYGAVVTEPINEDSDFGTFFLHNEGYSTMCGHAIIALVKLMHDTGALVKNDQNTEYRIDAPPGLIRARAQLKNNKVDRVFFKNVPSFVLLTNKKVEVAGIGEVKFDVAFGGAFYAFVDADSVGIGLEKTDFNQLVNWGMKIKSAVMENFEINHPFEEDLSFLYGTIFTGKPKNPNHHSRNVCIFAEGEVDRSSTGSGVSARAAIHSLKDGLKVDEEITIESILNTTMTVKVVEETLFGSYKAVIPEVSGTAHITGQNQFYFDPEDDLKNGFIFR
ncbi:MAG: proline racemase family protein [Bacteroidetes bacterium]|nr:proline racemase family protein [Bacteroidota bacterium]